MLRIAGRTLLFAAAVYVTLIGVLAAVMPNLELFGKVMAKIPRPLWVAIPMRPMFNVIRAGNLKIGDQAPDFDLPATDKQNHVRLSSFRDQKPVVLVFGSYT
jgi:hypothetical protein